MFYIFPNIVIIFHLCLRFSRNPLCAVQDARAGDFVVAVFLADRVEHPELHTGDCEKSEGTDEK